jgi:peptide/nickel transport system permease protein
MNPTTIPQLFDQTEGSEKRQRYQLMRFQLPPVVMLSMAILALMFITTLFADFIAPYTPEQMSLTARLKPPVLTGPEGTWQHPLGTDGTGRDILSRVIFGGRISIAVGMISTVLGLIIGTAAGLVSGFFGRAADRIIMYLVDVQLALPFLLLTIAVVLVLGKSLAVLIAMAALSTWPIYARVVRGLVLSLREREYVLAAESLGARSIHIALHHIVPGIVTTLMVLVTLNVGRIILLESALSFLGLGVQQPTPTWGNMINDGRTYLNTQWWIAVVPGTALVLLTLSLGVIGDWLRDILDVNLS